MMLRFENILLPALLIITLDSTKGYLSLPVIQRSTIQHQSFSVQQQHSFVTLYASSQDNNDDLDRPTPTSSSKSNDETFESAATNTLNERLMAELEQAENKERGPRFGAIAGLSSERTQKSDEERRKGIAEARNLNGVNPAVALTGGFLTLIVAAFLWSGTSQIARYFMYNPMDSDIYFIQRATAVFRNVVMGMASLASGFFGVTGLGIFLLGIRVAYGVAVGELDPTPIKKPRKSKDEWKLPNAWDLMTKPGRGRRRRK
mmetsp:Transcript_40083/g.45617  ORF Transcript_40083/g.45617 Transcript_40083/m.45617 type:complete len:260 (+) Transcript_40083:61-840(+)